MPASITHELVARETLGLLSPCVRDLIGRARDYYYLGAQGPDLFFFLQPLSKEINFGRLLHRARVRDWFEGMLLALPDFTGAEFEDCLAYVFGFCSHLSADVVFHPFVYHFLEAYDADRLTHQEIENDWDVYFLRALDGREVTRHSYPFDLKQIADDGILYRFVTDAARYYGREVPAGAFRRMCRGFHLYLSHTHAGHGRVLSCFGFEELYPREEPSALYLGGKQFERLSEGRGKDADELFALAVTESAARIRAFLEAFNADMPLPKCFSLHMLTGKPLEDQPSMEDKNDPSE